MTPQEQQMLQGLTERINQTQLPEKDLDAEQFLRPSAAIPTRSTSSLRPCWSNNMR